ncbi:hypothetical protein F4778DRAFT_72379 [Xylariomycetidae sp. FL2044]|nr:hypothetical protein F4778DRAFT_72379 [Xylariomycetidae sp. FL2044]
MGNSGRVYVRGEIFQRHHPNHDLDIFRAQYVPDSICAPHSWRCVSLNYARSENESFVSKRVSQSTYGLSLRLAAEFVGSRRIRMRVDHNPRQCDVAKPRRTDRKRRHQSIRHLLGG